MKVLLQSEGFENFATVSTASGPPGQQSPTPCDAHVPSHYFVGKLNLRDLNQSGGLQQKVLTKWIHSSALLIFWCIAGSPICLLGWNMLECWAFSASENLKAEDFVLWKPACRSCPACLFLRSSSDSCTTPRLARLQKVASDIREPNTCRPWRCDMN